MLADIYAARETDTWGFLPRIWLKRRQKLGTDAHYFPSFAEIENIFEGTLFPGDLLITMGAGDVVTVGEDLLKNRAFQSYPHFLHRVIYKKPGVTHEKVLFNPII